MERARLSRFPLDRSFEQQDPKTPLSEVVLRLVLDPFSDDAEVIGTATTLCGNLLVTARHVLERFLPGDGASPVPRELVAIQVLPGPEYALWHVLDGIADPLVDIALLRVASKPSSSRPEMGHGWRQPVVNPFAPAVGERIAAFGYADSTIRVSTNVANGPHLEVQDKPMVSVGVVQEIHETRRDQLLPFPCYRVSARFDRGMSGGPVFDETGAFCGLICSNLEGSHLDGDPISFVAMLWPLFRLNIDWNRGDDFPRDSAYPVIDLVRGGQIKITDRETLEKRFADFAPFASAQMP
ncbi:MAG: serine protease [Bauldia sp.]